MTFEYLKSQNLIISRTKRAFEVKEKTLFLVSRVLSFRHTKQTSKNVADTTFILKYTSSLCYFNTRSTFDANFVKLNQHFNVNLKYTSSII